MCSSSDYPPSLVETNVDSPVDWCKDIWDFQSNAMDKEIDTIVNSLVSSCNKKEIWKFTTGVGNVFVLSTKLTVRVHSFGENQLFHSKIIKMLTKKLNSSTEFVVDVDSVYYKGKINYDCLCVTM